MKKINPPLASVKKVMMERFAFYFHITKMQLGILEKKKKLGPRVTIKKNKIKKTLK